MESLDEYMTKVMHYLKGVAEKDELVTDGIQKLKTCEELIIKNRKESRCELEELREQLFNYQRENDKKTFEMEQLKEKLKSLQNDRENQKKRLESAVADLNSRIQEAGINWQKTKIELESRRVALSEKTRRTSAVSNVQQ